MSEVTAVKAKKQWKLPTYIKVTLWVSFLIILFALLFNSNARMDAMKKHIADNGVTTATVEPLDTRFTGVEGSANFLTVKYVVDGKQYSYNDKKSFLNPALDAGNTFDVVYDEDNPMNAEQVKIINGTIIMHSLIITLVLYCIFGLIRIWVDKKWPSIMAIDDTIEPIASNDSKMPVDHIIPNDSDTSNDSLTNQK